MATERTEREKVKDIEATLGVLKQIRQPYEPMIDNILTFINHGRRLIADKDAAKGNKTGTEIWDGTALGALNLLADGLYGYLIAPSMRWFSLSLPGKLNYPRWSGMRSWSGKRMDEYPEVKVWLENCEEVLYDAFLRSNFYDIMPDFFRDGGSVGTTTAFVEEDLDRNRIVFTVPHFRECYIAQNRHGQIDMVYREFKMTLRQLRDKFGMERMKQLQPDFENKHKANPHAELEVVHAVYPRKDYSPWKLNSLNKPVASVWLVRGGQEQLAQESGYDEYPCLTWRWRRNNDEWYGRSPGWDCFVDVVLSNQQGRTNLIAAHKMVETPMVGPEDLRGQVNSGPGGWTWMGTELWRSGALPRPLIENIQLPFALEAQQETQKKIKEHFHVDFFLMLSQAAFQKLNITATQVLEMQGEKAAVLGTRIGHLQSECFNPTIDIVFGLERRAGRIPDPPEILMEYQGKGIEVDYLGPLSQSQRRLFKTQSIAAGIGKLVELSSVYPQVLDLPDPDALAKELLTSYGLPAKCQRTEDEIKQLREAKMQAQQQQAALANATEMAKAIPAVSKTIEKGSALDLMTGAATA